MAVTSYWDESFKIKTLVPSLTSGNSITSPHNLLASSTVQLTVGTDDKVLRLFPYQTGEIQLKIELSDNSSMSEPYVGSITTNLNQDGGIEIPLENIKRVKISNQSAGNIDLSFLLLKQAQ